MKLLQIGLSLLLVLSPIACASVHEITPDAVSNINYGMEFRAVKKVIGTQGDVFLRWAEKGSNYFVIGYSVKKTNRDFCIVFKDDILIAFIEGSNFYKVFNKHTVPPVGRLPFEDGFEPLYSELVAQKYKSPHVKVNEVNEVNKFSSYAVLPAGILLLSIIYLGSLYATGDPDPLDLIPDIDWSADNNKDVHNIKKYVENFKKLSIGTSKETVIKLLGQPKSSIKSIGSDYEILACQYSDVIGLRAGKIEWILEGSVDSRLTFQPGESAPPTNKSELETENNINVYQKLKIEDTNSQTQLVKLRSDYADLSVSQVYSMPHISIFEKNKGGFKGYCTTKHNYKEKTINGDKVVLDYSTGLMWQQSGSLSSMNWQSAKKWVSELNREGHAGFNNWRLPTVDEAASLLEYGKRNGYLYITSYFDRKQKWIWTGDNRGFDRVWIVTFVSKDVFLGYDHYNYYVRPVRSLK